MIRHAGVLAIALLVMGFVRPAWAYQWAEVTAGETAVHDLSNGTSPVVERLTRGARIPVSDRMVRDVFGEYWFKTRVESGTYGFISGKAVRTEALIEEQRNAGLQEREIDRVDAGDRNWTYVIRAMLGGGTLTSDGALGIGGDVELTFTPFLNSEGYDRRRLSVGGFFQLAGSGSAFGASAAYRIFSSRRFEPEARIRTGLITTEGGSAFGAGFCVGARYPLSLAAGSHLSMYVEGQSFMGFSTGFPVLVSLGVGMGYHF